MARKHKFRKILANGILVFSVAAVAAALMLISIEKGFKFLPIFLGIIVVGIVIGYNNARFREGGVLSE